MSGKGFDTRKLMTGKDGKGLERNDGLQRLELMTKQLLKFVELHRLD